MTNARIMAGVARDQRRWVERRRAAFVNLLILAATHGYRGAPGVPVDTGELARSFHINGRPALDSTAELVLAGVSLGRPILYAWIAAHAWIIERGRLPDRNGVIRGSLQAPRGWFRIAMDIVTAEFKAGAGF
ncbi:MAG: hypothetical protein GY719_25895 [bacterium]|nr:hypothetical protein [bacterium]